MNAKLIAIEEKSVLENITSQYPILKDKMQEFDEFREDYRGISLDKVAKLYLAEKDLLKSKDKRQGLEKKGGGGHTAPSGKMSTEDAKRLRETNFKEYRKLLMAGKIDI